MVDSTAVLGAEVRVIGAKEGSADLDKFALSAKGAAASTTDLSNARAKAEAQWTNLTGVKTAATETAKLGAATAATGQSMGIFQRLVSGFGGFFGSFGRDAEGASTSMSHLAGAHGDVAKSIHVLHPLIGSMGGQLGGLSQFAIAARGGLTGLAIAITGALVISLEKSADSLRLLTNRLQALQGDEAGKKTFDLIAASASNTGASIATTGANVDALATKLGSLPQAWTGMAGTKAAQIIDTLAEAFKKTGTDADTAQTSIKKYIDEIGNLDPATKNISGLTQKLFDEIRKDSPEVAKLIAEGFGKMFPADAARSLQKFSDELAKTPKTVDQLNFALQRIRPELDKLKFDPTVTQGFVSLKNAFIDLWGAVGRSSQLTAVASSLQTITKYIRDLATNPAAAVEMLKGFGVVLLRLLSPMAGMTAAVGLFSTEIAKMAGGTQEATDTLSFLLKIIATVAAFTINPFAGIITGVVLFGTKIDDTIKKINSLIASFNNLPAPARAFLTGAAAGAATGTLVAGPVGGLVGTAVGGVAGMGSNALGGSAGAQIPQIPTTTGNNQVGIGTTRQVGSITFIDIPEQAKKATDAIDKLNTSVEKLGTDGTKSITDLTDQLGKVGDTPISDQSLQDFHLATMNMAGSVSVDFKTTINAISQSVLSAVNSVTSGVQSMVQSALQGIATLRQASAGLASAGNAVSGGGYASTQPGVSFDASMNDPTLQGFATGGAFTVGGSGGVDSTPIRFLATPGEVVTITPPGLSLPAGITAASSAFPSSVSVGGAATSSSSAISASAITNPISNAVVTTAGQARSALGTSTVQIVNAINAQTTATNNVASALANYSNLATGGTGSAKISPWKGNPAGTMSDYVPNSQIYASAKSDAQNFGQGTPTPDPTPYITDSMVYSPVISHAGDFATGGSISFRGGGTPDSKMVSLRASPDESIVISRPNAGKSDKAMNVTLNINGNISPLAFVAAEAQVKRAARRIFS
jgi:hypothetical protein